MVLTEFDQGTDPTVTQMNDNNGTLLHALAVDALNNRNQDMTAGKPRITEHQLVYDVLTAGTNIDATNCSNTRGYDSSTDKFWFVTTGDECDDSSIDTSLWTATVNGNGQVTEGTGGIVLDTRIVEPPLNPPLDSDANIYFNQDFRGSNDWMAAMDFTITVNPRTGTDGTYTLNIRNTAGTAVTLFTVTRSAADPTYTLDDQYYFYFDQTAEEVSVYSVDDTAEISGSPFDISSLSEWYIEILLDDSLTGGAGSYSGHDVGGTIRNIRCVEAGQTVNFRTSTQALTAKGLIVAGITDVTVGNGVDNGTINYGVSTNGGYAFEISTDANHLYACRAPITSFQLKHSYTVTTTFSVGTNYADTSIQGWAYYYDEG